MKVLGYYNHRLGQLPGQNNDFASDWSIQITWPQYLFLVGRNNDEGLACWVVRINLICFCFANIRYQRGLAHGQSEASINVTWPVLNNQRPVWGSRHNCGQDIYQIFNIREVLSSFVQRNQIQFIRFESLGWEKHDLKAFIRVKST